MKGDMRCVDGRLMRHDPQFDDPELETDRGACPGCSECEPEDDGALDACRALVAWDDAEKAGPDYGTLTRDTHPQGEVIWRRWWDDQQALCRHAFDTARAYLSRHNEEPTDAP